MSIPPPSPDEGGLYSHCRLYNAGNDTWDEFTGMTNTTVECNSWVYDQTTIYPTAVTEVDARTPIYTHTYIHIYIHTYIHTYLLTYIRTYVHTCMHTYISRMKIQDLAPLYKTTHNVQVWLQSVAYEIL